MARNCNKSGINTSNGKRVYVGTTQTVMTQHAGLIGLVDYLRSSNMWDLIVEKVGQHLPRSKRKSKHDSEAMLLQRLIALFVGKEDLNDHDNWKDPILLQVPGVSELASSSTLSRMESQVTDALLHEMNACLLEIFLRKEDPGMIWLDADSTPVPVEGYQEGTEYNGHSRCNCYLPLVIFANGLPIQVTFAGGTADGRNLLEKEIYDITETMQTRFPGTPIVLRGDAGFNRPVILDELEKRGCYYIIGFAPNTAVETMAADEWKPETTKYSVRASDGASIARALGRYRVRASVVEKEPEEGRPPRHRSSSGSARPEGDGQAATESGSHDGGGSPPRCHEYPQDRHCALSSGTCRCARRTALRSSLLPARSQLRRPLQ